MATKGFSGFPKEGLGFLAELERHNDRDWFKTNKVRFEDTVMAPARDFVTALGERLQAVAPDLVADPRTDRSIFRLHRDTRFSKNKSPYKTHLAIFLWEGQGKKMECPGLYFHLEKDKLMLGGGIYCFTKEQLEAWRKSVVDRRRGPEIVRVLKEAQKAFPGPMHGEPYKRVPRGYAKDHPRAELLKLKGVTVGVEGPVPKSLHTRRAVEYVAARFERMAPLHRWLVKLAERA